MVIFKRYYLFQHLKQCKSKPDTIKNERTKAQSEAQNMQLVFDDDDKQLENEVFPRMLVDAISTVAKTDKIICLQVFEMSPEKAPNKCCISKNENTCSSGITN